jgi:hypothetical protein
MDRLQHRHGRDDLDPVLRPAAGRRPAGSIPGLVLAAASEALASRPRLGCLHPGHPAAAHPLAAVVGGPAPRLRQQQCRLRHPGPGWSGRHSAAVAALRLRVHRQYDLGPLGLPRRHDHGADRGHVAARHAADAGAPGPRLLRNVDATAVCRGRPGADPLRGRRGAAQPLRAPLLRRRGARRPATDGPSCQQHREPRATETHCGAGGCHAGRRTRRPAAQRRQPSPL